MRFLLEVVDSVLRVLKALSVELVWNVAEYRCLERMSQKSPLHVGIHAVFIGFSERVLSRLWLKVSRKSWVTT